MSSIVKPNAKVKGIVTSKHEEFGSEDFIVLLGGTNDVAFNETHELRKSLRRKLNDLRLNNVIVFSVPLRHDLPDWSCINEEVRRTNDKIQKLCSYFKNCSYFDLSLLGKGFHTANGFHLNQRGKQYISSKIVECVDNYFSMKDMCMTKPIALNDRPCNFLDL